MSWIATIDTPQGVVVDRDPADVVLAFSDALDDVLGLTGSATSINSETGVLSATFTIGVETIHEAAEVGVDVFNRALELVGLPAGNVVHFEADPSEDRELLTV
jgi:hypothetical protein